MRQRGRLLRGTLLFLAGALAAGAVALASGGGSDQIRVTSVSDGTPVLSIRPTGVGLPLIGGTASVGAGDLAPRLDAYHDSGDYEADLAAVDAEAQRYLLWRLRQLEAKRRHCEAGAPSGAEKGAASRCERSKPALVLDIDETALSNYAHLGDYKNIIASLAQAAVAADAPAIAPTLKLYDEARAHGVAVFFITGRPTGFSSLTVKGLTNAGYSGWQGLALNPGGQSLTDYKSGVRAWLESIGFDIVVNVGDQESDLAGGHADRAFKLPNPFYYSP